MSSAFNLLTTGASFDRRRFGKDIELFSSATSKQKGKQRQDPRRVDESDGEGSGSDSDGASSSSASSSSSSKTRQAPPAQKITLSGPDPLPKSLHANLFSLVNHPTSPLPSAAGTPLLAALRHANIQSLWGVQCAVSGCLLDGLDAMCVAPTGSGKTLAYLLPLLVRLKDPARITGQHGIRSLVLVPTHDLAVQIKAVLQAVTQGRPWRTMLLSKATEKAVCESDKNLGIDVLVATPERLHHLVDSKQLSLDSTSLVVLDESDRLFSPDFLPQVLPILAAAAAAQKCFLSATMPSGAEAIAKSHLSPTSIRVVVGVKDSAVSTVDQSLLYTGSEQGKLLALRDLVSTGSLPYPSLVFVQSVERAEQLYKTLLLDGLRVDTVHGDRSKAQRDAAVAGFRKGDVWILVVTEVLARGIDFRGVKVVVNYDFPQSVPSYIHRIGRTGRAGRPGKAITFFSNEDGPHLRTIANVLRASGCPVPEYMLDLKKPSKNLKRLRAKIPVKRKPVGGGGRDVSKEKARRKKAMIQASKQKA